MNKVYCCDCSYFYSGAGIGERCTTPVDKGDHYSKERVKKPQIGPSWRNKTNTCGLYKRKWWKIWRSKNE